MTDAIDHPEPIDQPESHGSATPAPSPDAHSAADGQPERKPPFDAFSFHADYPASGTVDVRLERTGDTYQLTVESGPTKREQAAHALIAADFTRTVPFERAVELRDAIQAAGVYGWEETYGDEASFHGFAWKLAVDFKKDVFAIQCEGGSDLPEGFDQVLEALYRLDLPRPTAAVVRENPAAFVGAVEVANDPEEAPTDLSDMSQLFGQLPPGMFGGVSMDDMRAAFEEFQRNPEQFRDPLRRQFAQLPPMFQNQILDALGSTGMQSREWWEHYLRG